MSNVGKVSFIPYSINEVPKSPNSLSPSTRSTQEIAQKRMQASHKEQRSWPWRKIIFLGISTGVVSALGFDYLRKDIHLTNLKKHITELETLNTALNAALNEKTQQNLDGIKDFMIESISQTKLPECMDLTAQCIAKIAELEAFNTDCTNLNAQCIAKVKELEAFNLSCGSLNTPPCAEIEKKLQALNTEYADLNTEYTAEIDTLQDLNTRCIRELKNIQALNTELLETTNCTSTLTKCREAIHNLTIQITGWKNLTEQCMHRKWFWPW